MTTKEINCTRHTLSLQDLGEPEAYFTVSIPKAAKHLGNCVKNAQNDALHCICLQTDDKGHSFLIATDAYILTAFGVLRYGDKTASECFIHPKAIRDLAGKEVDVAMWQDETYKKHGQIKHYLTACEAEGVRSQYQCTGQTFPDWKRVMNRETALCSTIVSRDIPKLQKFVRNEMGKTKKERQDRAVVIRANKGDRQMDIEIYDRSDNMLVSAMKVNLSKQAAKRFQFVHSAERFYYAIQADFCGDIRCTTDSISSVYYGAQSTTMLIALPNGIGGEITSYCE